MSKIVVGFSRPQFWISPFSWLIRLAYLSPFSHAYIRFELPHEQRDIVLQASGLVVNFISEPNFDAKEVIYKEFTFPITPEKKLALIQFGIDQLGKPYSVTGILGMALVRIGQLLHIKINNPFTYDGTSDFCSEMTAVILEQFEGVVISQPVANLAPADLYKIVAALPVSGG